MSISIYLNGTDDLTDGTLATAGNGITLGAINEVVTVHLRSPAGYANAEAVTVPAPIDCHVSTHGSAWGESAVYPIGAIPDTNTPLHVKRVVNTVTPPGGAPYETGIALTPRAALVSVADLAGPVIAGTLTATPTATQGQVTLSGPTATDNVGIAKWQRQTDGGAWVDVASTAGTFPTTTVSGLAIGSRSFAVRAVDAAGNASATRTASATVADITAPALTGTIAATPTTTSIALDWPNATDNVGVTGYQIEWGATTSYGSSATSATSAYTITGLTASTLRYFRVRAYDAAGNMSAWLTGSATTSAGVDTTAPVIAGTLTAVAGGGQVTLSGPTATDNVGIAKWQYRIDGGAWVDIVSTSETMPSTVVPGRTAGIAYDFDVRALDAAGNASGVLSATSAIVLAFYDDFTGSGALSTVDWFTSTAGSGTASRNGSGQLVINSVGNTANAALVCLKSPLTLAANRTYRTKARVVDNSFTQADLLCVSQKQTGYPTVASGSGTGNWINVRYEMGPYIRFEVRVVSGTAYAVAYAMNESYTTARRWNVATSQWVSPGATTDGYALSYGVDYIFEIDTNTEGVRWTMRDNSETIIFQTTRLQWASIAGYDYPAYLVMGEVYTSSHTAEVRYDYLSVS